MIRIDNRIYRMEDFGKKKFMSLIDVDSGDGVCDVEKCAECHTVLNRDAVDAVHMYNKHKYSDLTLEEYLIKLGFGHLE